MLSGGRFSAPTEMTVLLQMLKRCVDSVVSRGDEVTLGYDFRPVFYPSSIIHSSIVRVVLSKFTPIFTTFRLSAS